MNVRTIADELEATIRALCDVSPADQWFKRSIDLMDAGYVDSVAVVELLDHIEETYRIEIPDDVLLSEEFTTIDGMAMAISELTAVTDRNVS